MSKLSERSANQASGASPDLADLLKQVRRIELRTERLVSDLTTGRYRSAFRGTGLDFDEVREYTVGDDVRHIDWNVTARAGRPFVKTFREERELTTLLVVDVSGSMRFGAIPGVSPRAKLALAAEAAAVMAVMALRNHDRIGLVTFAERGELRLPARKGRGHIMRLLREVLSANTGARGRPTDFAVALDGLRQACKRRGVVFVISDFLGADLRFADALARAARRHDVVGLRVCDPGEERLPPGRMPLRLTDPESGAEAVLANGAQARAAYAAAWAEQRQRVETWFRAASCDLVDLRTDVPAIDALTRFVERRKRRIRA